MGEPERLAITRDVESEKKKKKKKKAGKETKRTKQTKGSEQKEKKTYKETYTNTRLVVKINTKQRKDTAEEKEKV